MVKCVNMATYKARMCCIDPKEKFIIISTIENFIADAIKGKGNLTDEFGVVNKEGFNETLKETLNTFFRSINEAAEKFPDTKFSVITPIQRPIHQWYTDNIDYMCKLFNDGMKMIKHGNVAKINCISKASQQFDEQGVHLTPSSGKIFVEEILRLSENFFDSEQVDISMDIDGDGVNGAGLETGEGLENKVKKLEMRLKALESRKEDDNLMMARIREELDAISNAKKEDRVVITGLTNSIPMPEDKEARKKWLMDMVASLLNRVEPGSEKKIIFINQGRRMDRAISMVEVRLESKEDAFKIRNAFVAKKKGGADFGRIHISNSVCLATRVRVDILRGIARQFTVEGGDDMFVSAFNSRPVLRIKEPNNQRDYALTFADAIARFGPLIQEENLTEAYKRAGTAFRSQLEQHFVVMKDSPQTDEQRFQNPQKRRIETNERMENRGAGSSRASMAGRGWGRGGNRGTRGSKYTKK